MRAKGVIEGFVVFLLALPQAAFTADTKEMRFGFYADKEVLSAQTMVFNDTVSKRIDEIGNRVVRVSGRPDVKYTFRVVNDATINAYAAAGGFVYVNTGLLDILESEDELAAILAHEIGHVSESHQIKFMHSAHQKKVTGTMLGIAVGVGLGVAGAYAAGPAPSPYSSSYGYHQQLTRQMVDLGMKAGFALGEAMTVSMIKGYGRKQELEADALAIQYTHKAGYEPEALVSVLKRLTSIRDRLKLNERNYVSSVINAEPGLEVRITLAEGLISKTE